MEETFSSEYLRLEQLFDDTIGSIGRNLESYYQDDRFNRYDVELENLQETYSDERLKQMTLTLRYFFVDLDNLYRVVYRDTPRYTNMMIDRTIPIEDMERLDIVIMMACFNIICKMYASQGNYLSNAFYAIMAGVPLTTFNIVEQIVLTAYLNNINEIEAV